MPAPKRRPQPGLIGQLFDAPHRFNFFQAVRILDLWLRRTDRVTAHGKTLGSLLRFNNSVSLAFPASQIEALSVDADVPSERSKDRCDAPDPQQLRRISITPAFMGFLGVNGVLPRAYTATIAEQIHFDKNAAGRAFFDTFSHGSMMLFYRAWAASRIEYRGHREGRDGFLDLQLALAGRSVTRPAAAALPDEVVARYAALIRHRPMTGDMIAAVLADYFRVPFRFQPFVGAWAGIPPDDLLQLGTRNNVLGHGTMLAPRYWRADAIARLWVGPLADADFDRFLPNGSAAGALRAMLALFAVPTVVFEICLILRAPDVKPARLHTPRGLGRGTFLVTRPQTADNDSTRYHIAF